MNNRDILIVILIFIVIVIDLTLLAWNFDLLGLNKLQKDIQAAPQKCEALGGTYVSIIYVKFGQQCYDYDEDGFRFYWRQDENGRDYKER